MIINNWFKDGLINKNNNKWTNSREREIIINNEEDEESDEKLFFTRAYSLNNTDTDYGTTNHICTTTMNSYICQTMNSSGGSSCENAQQHLTPKQFLEKYSLPRVVKIIPQEPIADSCGNFDPITLLSGQLLMYKHYSSGKVEARSFPNDRKDYSSLVVIPETYKGWFSVVTERGQIKARIYSSIQRLVSAQVTVFLSTSQDLPAYIQTNSDEISTQYTKTSVKSGSILKLLAVYQDLNSNQSTKSKRLSWPLIGSKQHTSRYAQCLSSSNQALFINLNTPGQFYAVSMTHNSTEENVTKVYQIQKLLRTFPLPVRVTIIGANKNHGSMLLENYHKEHVVLSCVLDGADVTTNDSTNEKFRLLEIDVNSKFYVIKPGGRDIDERRLFYSPLVQRAMKFCNENSEQWISQLKIIHHIYPQNSNQILANLQNVSMEKSKRNRKVSIGDKITVKSASFRYSTSYGNEVTRPLIRKQDLEKPNKPKVYDFNYKQTHEFLSLSSNTSKDTNNFNQENTLQDINVSTFPDINQERVYAHQADIGSQIPRSNNISHFPLPYCSSSQSQNNELEKKHYNQDNRNRFDFHQSSDLTKENSQENKFKRLSSGQNTSLPNKPNLAIRNSNIENKNVRQMTSLINKETLNAHDSKRQITIRHSFNHSSVHENLKSKITRNNESNSASLPDNSTNKVDIIKRSSITNEEISAVERLDRLTQSCNLLSLLNKNNSYQNVSQNDRHNHMMMHENNNMKHCDREEDMKIKSQDSLTTDDITGNIETENRQAKKEINRYFKPNIENLVQGNGTDNASQQHLQNYKIAQRSKQEDFSHAKNKQVYTPRPRDYYLPKIHSYRQNNDMSSMQNTKNLDGNTICLLRQENHQQKANENQSQSTQPSVYNSTNSPINVAAKNYTPRNETINQQNINATSQQPLAHTSSNAVQKQQIAKAYVSTNSSTSSSSRPMNVYSYNSNNSNKYNNPTGNIKPTPANPSLTSPAPIKTHTKTPVPMPRLNVSYSKVHDAIYTKNESTSSENIYAEISDR